MGVGSSWGPRHGKDNVEWNTESFGAVNVGEAGRVCNDRIGDKWLLSVEIWLDAGLPAAFQYVFNHLTLPADVTFSKGFHARYEPWILDHVLHQMFSRNCVFPWRPHNLPPSIRQDLPQLDKTPGRLSGQSL